MNTDIIVVGGGAAGLMAAGTAAERGKKVLLLEHNEKLGKKLFITGKGRCNATNNCSPQEFLNNVTRNARFLYSAAYGFTPQDMMQLLEKWGCPLKTERGNRVFPVSDRSADVIDALKKRFRENGGKVLYENVRSVITKEGTAVGTVTENTSHYASAVIMATGGVSYPLTGSDGSGLKIAEDLGHTVVEPVGSLVPLVELGNKCAKMQGLTLKNVGVKLAELNGKVLYEDFGELTFASYGLTGPTVLSASAHMVKGKQYEIRINLKPALDEQKLDQRILRDFEEDKNRELGAVLGLLLPRSMIPVIAETASVDPALPVNSVTRTDRKRLLDTLKCFRIPIYGKRPVDEAIVTSGGVKVSEISPKTMESKLIHNLFFAGEMIDVDAYTGGFNLQIAWSTGYAAAMAAAERG